MYEMSKLCYRVSEDDVTRARNQMKSSLLLHIDGTSPVAEDIGRQLLTYGRRIPFTELFARIDAVDAKTVKRVANRFIFDKDVAISAMEPIQSLPDYNWFRRMQDLLATLLDYFSLSLVLLVYKRSCIWRKKAFPS
ncbi:hypothetical protein Sjap_024034 [Stephania japonica]|uniref:Mitochondrial processing peptidase n=2 Tax=Magnoliopsida TaxID=3398 RepID=A0AAP0EHG8_9MAGN